MERLTKNSGEMVWSIQGDVALEPHEVAVDFNGTRYVREMMSKLASFEDEEEQGRLIHLPCRMHATIYLVVTKRARAYSAKPFRFVKTSYMTWNNLESVLRNFGKTVFLTHEEAVAAMNKMNEGDRNGPVL
ncbi:MAG: hypothetical protein IJI27_08275 [Oscillospiraceae bacterium]|nr:hypothetical protein [Oscillospiraceae bacterium]